MCCSGKANFVLFFTFILCLIAYSPQQVHAQNAAAQAANSGPSTQQLFDQAIDKTEEFDSAGWPAKGRTTFSQKFTDDLVELNRMLWVKHNLFYLFVPTLMIQQGTQGGDKDFTANAQYQGLFGWRAYKDTPLGTGYFIFNNIQVTQLTKTSGVNMSQALGINYFISDSVGETSAVKSLLWRNEFAGDFLTLMVGHGEIGELDGGCRYACDDTTSFISSPLSSNPNRTLPGQGPMVSADFNLSSNVIVEATVADAQGDGNIDFNRVFRTGELAYAGALKIVNPFEETGDGVYKLTYYRVDATRKGTKNTQAPSEGLTIQLDQDFSPLGVFAKYSKTFKRRGSVKQSGAAGVMWKEPFGYDEDIAGIGVGWVDPTAKDTRDEYVAEAFYRLQLTPFIQITPDAMLIINPSNRMNKDLEAAFTLRARGSF
jgi:hypothetical protein